MTVDTDKGRLEALLPCMDNVILKYNDMNTKAQVKVRWNSDGKTHIIDTGQAAVK